jgi:hypothetical protein
MSSNNKATPLIGSFSPSAKELALNLQRSDETHADEWYSGFRWAGLLCSAITAIVIYCFLDKALVGHVGVTYSWLFALAAAIAIETVKYRYGLKAILAIFQTDWERPRVASEKVFVVARLAGITLFVVAFYAISVGITVFWTVEQTASVRKESNLRNAYTSPQILELDEKIKTAQLAQANALNIKWKGVVTLSGQTLANAKAEEIGGLQSERKALVELGHEKLTAETSTFLRILQKAGGFAEFGLLFCQIMCAVLLISLSKTLSKRNNLSESVNTARNHNYEQPQNEQAKIEQLERQLQRLRNLSNGNSNANFSAGASPQNGHLNHNVQTLFQG